MLFELQKPIKMVREELRRNWGQSARKIAKKINISKKSVQNIIKYDVLKKKIRFMV